MQITKYYLDTTRMGRWSDATSVKGILQDLGTDQTCCKYT